MDTNPRTRPRFLRVGGVAIDTSLCFQRYCSVRQCFVIQNLRDPVFCLEVPDRIPQLRLGRRGI